MTTVETHGDDLDGGRGAPPPSILLARKRAYKPTAPSPIAFAALDLVNDLCLDEAAVRKLDDMLGDDNRRWWRAADAEANLLGRADADPGDMCTLAALGLLRVAKLNRWRRGP